MADEVDAFVNLGNKAEGAPLPPFYKFERPGDTLLGILEPIRTINSPLSSTGTAEICNVITKQGTVTITMTADLKRKLVDLTGKFVGIKFLGWKNGKTKAVSLEPVQGTGWFKEFEVRYQ